MMVRPHRVVLCHRSVINSSVASSSVGVGGGGSGSSSSNNNVRSALFFFPGSSLSSSSSPSSSSFSTSASTSTSSSSSCHRTVSIPTTKTTTPVTTGSSPATLSSSSSLVLRRSLSTFLRNAQETAGGGGGVGVTAGQYHHNHHHHNNHHNHPSNPHSSFLTRQHSAIWWNLSRGLSSGSETAAAFSAKTTDAPNSEPTEPGVEVIYFRGLPQFTIPLPSRREKCRFIVKPLANTVGDLMSMIREEDKGVDRVALLSTRDGVRIGASNTIEMLMENDFDLVINDRVYRCKTPPQEKPSEEELERLSSVRNLVGQLYAALNVDEHQLKQEHDMMTELERLLLELQPMEEKRKLLAQQATKRTTVLTWVGLGLMSVQFGILARLTWWEYSWDIMEPITYFVTYGTAMLCYAYFVLTKQEYVLPEVKDRQYLIAFHKNAKKIGLDVDRYNQLKTQIDGIETDLKRLRDPLALHLPLKTRQSKSFDLSKFSFDSSTTSNILHKLQDLWKKSQMQAQAATASTSSQASSAQSQQPQQQQQQHQQQQNNPTT